MPYRTRFAPSPTGFLHLGNIRTAIFNWLVAEAAGGAMLLRLEDTDKTRDSIAFAAAIEEDLQWLGITWEGDANGKPWRQSARAAAHQKAMQTLFDADLAYYCFCSPEALAAERQAQLRAGRPPRYSGRCAKLSAAEAQKRRANGEAAAVRFRMTAAPIVFDDLVRGKMNFIGADIGDFVVRRSNGDFSFFFVNAVDDAQCGITAVLRGDDHLANTPRQLALLAALNLPAPLYGHLPLLTASGGAPLSKRSGANSIRDLRARGFLPSAIWNYLARAGHSMADDSPMEKTALAAAFNTQALTKSPSAFDDKQLLHRQKEAVLHLSAAAWSEWLRPSMPHWADNVEFYHAVRENVCLHDDVAQWAEVIGDKVSLTPAAAAAVAAAGNDFYAAALAAVEDDMTWQPFCARVNERTKRRGRALFLPLRAALTGRTEGPAMPPLYKLIGAERAKERLRIHLGEQTAD